MVQRVTVSPSEVRGYGDIVSPKTTEDFETYNCSLTFQEDMYTMEVGGYSVSLTLSSNSVFYEETVTLTATVINLETGTPVTGETVEFLAGETSLGTDTTDSEGVATVTESTLLPNTYTIYAQYGDNVGSASLTVKKHNIWSISNTQSPTYYDSSYIVFEGQILASDNDITTTFPVPNVSIDVYTSAGGLGYDTKLGTVTSDSNGEFDTGTLIPYNSSTINKGYYFKFEGNTIYGTRSSQTKTAVLSKYPTYIVTTGEHSTWYLEDGEDSFEVGLGIVSDDPTIAGKSLKVYLDNTLIETVTSLQGSVEVDYTYSGTGTYVWKVEFEGDSNYEASSKTWNTVVSNFTDSIVLSASSSSILVGGSVTLSATVTDINGGVVSGQSVSFYDGGTLLGSATTNSSGVASLVFSGSVVGVHSISASSYGVISNTVSITVSNAPTPASISLTGTKNILSYADSESSVLTATVLDDNDDPVEGATVELYKDNVLWDTLTTSSAGTVSKTYTSAGVGDVGFTAECGSLVTESLVVHDYYYYDSLTVDKSRYTTISGSPSLSYSSDGLNVNTSVASVALIRNNFLTLPSDYEAEMTITAVSSGAKTGICFDDLLLDGGSSATVIYKLSNTSKQGQVNNSVYTDNTVVKIRKQGSTFTVYFNDVQKWTGTITDDNHYQQFRTYQNRSTTFKDLKIKSL